MNQNENPQVLFPGLKSNGDGTVSISRPVPFAEPNQDNPHLDLLKRIKSLVEDLMEYKDDYRAGRSAEAIIADGDMPKEYAELCDLIAKSEQSLQVKS